MTYHHARNATKHVLKIINNRYLLFTLFVKSCTNKELVFCCFELFVYKEAAKHRHISKLW